MARLVSGMGSGHPTDRARCGQDGRLPIAEIDPPRRMDELQEAIRAIQRMGVKVALHEASCADIARLV
jgi:hypothetical protein